MDKTVKGLEDLERRLLELRCGGKLPSLDDTETINDAILVVQTLKALKLFGITEVKVSKS